jgi:hypothetical protein
VTAVLSVAGDQVSTALHPVRSVAVRSVGAAGGVVSGPVSVAGVTTVTEFDDGERRPWKSMADTRNEYCAVRDRPVIVAVVTLPTRVSWTTSSKARMYVIS